MKVSSSKKETAKIAKELVEKILRLRSEQQAVVVGLSGELGSGKTAFCQSFAKALGMKEKVHSPTFIIFRKHEIRNTKFENLYHFDAYRLKNPREIITLGWGKIISDPKNIILVEWAENVKKIFPKNYFWAKLSHLAAKKRAKGKNKRGIDIKFIK